VQASAWQAYAAMNVDPRVMEHFPKLLTHEESDAMVDRIEALPVLTQEGSDRRGVVAEETGCRGDNGGSRMRLWLRGLGRRWSGQQS
jgi:hypothetical protein